jgi:hypothetical protein
LRKILAAMRLVRADTLADLAYLTADARSADEVLEVARRLADEVKR